jgi:hypothetical protein
MVENDLEPVQNQPAPDPVIQPSPQPQESNTSPQQPIEHLNGSNRRMVILVGVVMALIVVAAVVYAYSQGLLTNPVTTTTPAATPATSSAVPSTSSDIQSLDATSTQLNSDVQDLNQAASGLDSIDTSGDQTPAL